MTEPRRFQSPTGRLSEYKMPTLTPMERATYRRQASLYMQAYEHCSPMPNGREETLQAIGEKLLGAYSPRDIEQTMSWWHKFGPAYALPTNKLRGRNNGIYTLNDLIRPETLARMTRPIPRLLGWPWQEHLIV